MSTTIWRADFSRGLSVGADDSAWFYFGEGDSIGDDAIATSTDSGLRVVSRGVNPATGEPAFTRTAGPEKGPLPGEFDHFKFLAYVNHMSAHGTPGFDIASGEKLTVEAVLSGRTYGVEGHPFRDAVKDSESDYRLAAFSLNTIDVTKSMTSDFFVTNSMIWVLYERLPFAREALGNYASFTFLIPVMERAIDDVHRYAISYDRDSNTITWSIDGRIVFEVDKPGCHINRKYMAIDLGGDETLVTLDQLNGGLGLFAMLDCTQPTGTGLVNLAPHAPGQYLDPATGRPGLAFVDNVSHPSNRLFGQGAEMTVREFTIARG